MEKETITDNLEKLLMAIHRQVVIIRDADQQVPKIEMDKTLSNIRALYEQFTVLNYLNSHPVEKKIPAEQNDVRSEMEYAKHNIEEKAAVVEPKVESPFIPIVEKSQEPIVPPSDVNIQASNQNPVYKEAEVAKPAHESYMPPKQAEPITQKQPDAEPVKPVIQAQMKETKSASEPQRLGDKLRLQKIEDIHKAITLSDKFLFMNELFEAENNAYKEAVDMLNRLSSSSEAEQYMNSLASRYRWEDHSKTEKKFRDLVARKFV